MIEKIIEMSLETEVKIENDTWIFKFLRPKEKLDRAVMVSQLINFVPVDSVTNEDYNRAFILATLQTAYISGPPLFKDKLKEDFSLITDEGYLILIYQGYIEKESRFEEGKKKLRLGSGSKKESLGT